MISHEELIALFLYDPSTGEFIRRVRMGEFKAGTIAGSITKNGYRLIGIKGKRYLAHRLAWFYINKEWPTTDVDHKTMKKTDNRIAELRTATRTQNMQNIRKHRDNTSGYKGVSWDKTRNLWRATIQIEGKWRQLGRFKTAEEASATYTTAAMRHFGEFARAA